MHRSFVFDVFFDIVKYSNEDIVIEFTDNHVNSPRIFFGLKTNGRYLYGDKIIMPNESFIYIEEDSGNPTLNAFPFIVKDEDYNEYIISSMDSFVAYFEAYDFYTKTKTYQEYRTIFNFEKNEGIFNFIEIKENDEYYVMVCGNFNEENIYFKLIKIKLKTEENLIINQISNSAEEIQVNDNFDYHGCYAIETEKIICFIYNSKSKLIIYIFNYQLVKEGFKEFKIF